MANSKRYGVLLNDFAIGEIGKLIAAWSKSNDFGTYLLAKSVEPNGPFLTIVIEDNPPPGMGPVPDIELQIPHSFVKAIVYATDIKKMGFVAV